MLRDKLRGLYVITDNKLTPNEDILQKVELSLKGGAKIVQLRDKKNSYEEVKQIAIKIQDLAKKYDALFVLNDDVNLACEIQCDGLHIGKSDYINFEQIRKNFKGLIGVSCYGDINHGKIFRDLGADYVAFGSFFSSPTKPDSNIVPLSTISEAKKQLDIPICAIGGINGQNISKVMEQEPDMVSLISDIWTSDDIKSKSNFYANKF